MAAAAPPAPQIPQIPVESSNLESIGYDKPTKALEVVFKTGGKYRYDDIPGFIFRRMMKAKSKGKALYRMVLKPKLPFTKIALDPFLSGFFDELCKFAGPVKKQVTFDGQTIRLEYLPGDTREGVNKATGEKWSKVMNAAYGHIPKTKGLDGEAVDVYLAPDARPGSPVFVVHQVKKDKTPDEDKVMLGFESMAAAKAAYLQHTPSWCFGSIVEMPRARLEQYLAGAAKMKDRRKDSAWTPS